MSYLTRTIAHCDICGHEWLPRMPSPSHCASSKCRSRRWNSGEAAVPVWYSGETKIVFVPEHGDGSAVLESEKAADGQWTSISPTGVSAVGGGRL